MFISQRCTLTLLVAIAAVFPATPAHAQWEPSISIEWQTRQMGTVAPGTSFNWSNRVHVFSIGTTVSAQTTSATTVVSPASQFISAGQSAPFTINGTVPTATGPFTITINFTYSTSSGPVTTPVWITGTVSSGVPGSTTYFVGVIPQTVSATPSAADCPPGASLVYFHFDDEDSDNENNRSGWIGAIKSYENTIFYYCRVDGRQFKPLSTTNSVANHYALIRLGTACPPGSTAFSRYWDNENNNNINSRWTSSGNALDFGPNSVVADSQNSIMHFCLFRSGTDTMSDFPNLGIHYGVFAAPGFSKAIQSGWVYTDDEDSTNDNSMSADADAQRIIAPTGSDGRNTTVYTARVTPETSPVARCSVSPSAGIDSAYATFVNNGSYARVGRTISSYSWSFSSGGSAFGPGPHARSFGVGTHWGRLTVTDSAGESSAAMCYVTVSSSTPGGCQQVSSLMTEGEKFLKPPPCP
ncbi:hypothetical protein [Hyalangium gracile]|uniref:hypothetical protein n=1 Tax=Hyalangium gracile TaxID=394092 RepID=UPI001CCE0C06|nr:hypothetical protein [Hyalangium gracile]